MDTNINNRTEVITNENKNEEIKFLVNLREIQETMEEDVISSTLAAMSNALQLPIMGIGATQKIIEEIIDDGQNDEGVAEVMKFGVELIYGGLRIGYTILTSPTNAALRSAQYMMENISPDTKRAISMAKSCLSEVTSRGVAVAR